MAAAGGVQGGRDPNVETVFSFAMMNCSYSISEATLALQSGKVSPKDARRLAIKLLDVKILQLALTIIHQKEKVTGHPLIDGDPEGIEVMKRGYPLYEQTLACFCDHMDGEEQKQFVRRVSRLFDSMILIANRTQERNVGADETAKKDERDVAMYGLLGLHRFIARELLHIDHKPSRLWVRSVRGEKQTALKHNYYHCRGSLLAADLALELLGAIIKVTPESVEYGLLSSESVLDCVRKKPNHAQNPCLETLDSSMEELIESLKRRVSFWKEPRLAIRGSPLFGLKHLFPRGIDPRSFSK